MVKNYLGDLAIYIVAICVTIVIVYFMYIIGKHVNYSLFYEDMVRQTVTDMVREEALK